MSYFGVYIVSNTNGQDRCFIIPFPSFLVIYVCAHCSGTVAQANMHMSKSVCMMNNGVYSDCCSIQVLSTGFLKEVDVGYRQDYNY